jgi:hypothetical protein
MFGLLALTFPAVVQVCAGVTVILGAAKLAVETARAAADYREALSARNKESG